MRALSPSRASALPWTTAAPAPPKPAWDFGSEQLARWSRAVSRAVERRHRFRPEAPLEDNAVFRLLLGRSARRRHWLSTENPARLRPLHDPALRELIALTPTAPEEAADGMIAFLLARPEDAPEITPQPRLWEATAFAVAGLVTLFVSMGVSGARKRVGVFLENPLSSWWNCVRDIREWLGTGANGAHLAALFAAAIAAAWLLLDSLQRIAPAQQALLAGDALSVGPNWTETLRELTRRERWQSALLSHWMLVLLGFGTALAALLALAALIQPGAFALLESWHGVAWCFLGASALGAAVSIGAARFAASRLYPWLRERLARRLVALAAE